MYKIISHKQPKPGFIKRTQAEYRLNFLVDLAIKESIENEMNKKISRTWKMIRISQQIQNYVEREQKQETLGNKDKYFNSCEAAIKQKAEEQITRIYQTAFKAISDNPQIDEDTLAMLEIINLYNFLQGFNKQERKIVMGHMIMLYENVTKNDGNRLIRYESDRYLFRKKIVRVPLKDIFSMSIYNNFFKLKAKYETMIQAPSIREHTLQVYIKGLTNSYCLLEENDSEGLSIINQVTEAKQKIMDIRAKNKNL